MGGSSKIQAHLVFHILQIPVYFYKYVNLLLVWTANKFRLNKIHFWFLAQQSPQEPGMQSHKSSDYGSNFASVDELSRPVLGIIHHHFVFGVW